MLFKKVAARWLRKIANPEHPQWQEFLAERYNKGEREVPNPHRGPQRKERVLFWTAYKDPVTREKIHEEFQAWLKEKSTESAQTSSRGPVFLSGNRYREWVQKVDNSSLQSGQKAAIRYYSENGYKPLNKGLREGNSSSFDQNYIKQLDVAFETPAAEIRESLKVTRAFTAKHPIAKAFNEKTLQPGQVFTDKGYLSTSTQEDWPSYEGSEFAMHITVLKGAKGIYLGPVPRNPSSYVSDSLSFTPEEYEMLLPRNSSVRITKIDRARKIIECELL